MRAEVADRRRLVVGAVLGTVLVGVFVGAVALPTDVDARGDRPGTVDAPPFATYEIESSVVADEAGTAGTYTRRGEFVAGDGRLRDRLENHQPGAELTVERYRDADEGRETVRLTTDDEDARNAQIDASEDHELLATSRSDDEFVVVTAEETDEGFEDRAAAYVEESGVARTLQYPAYRQTGEASYRGRDVSVHEPRDGWYDAATLGQRYAEYRVTDAEGELHVDAETGTLLHVDVSFTVVGADSYAAYAVERLVGDRVVGFDVEFDVQPDGDVERPAWAEEPE